MCMFEQPKLPEIKEEEKKIPEPLMPAVEDNVSGQKAKKKGISALTIDLNPSNIGSGLQV